MKKASLRFFDSISDLLTKREDLKEALWIVDNRFQNQLEPKLNNAYFVESGEDLKDIQSLPLHMKNILDTCSEIPKDKLQIVAFGGGSIGDFSGFVASVLKRGVQLIHAPTTWLSFIDSSHGGKTAMNLGSYKNQIGSFHPAKENLVIKDLLLSQGEDLYLEGMAEVIKIALLKDPVLFEKILNKEASSDIDWEIFQRAIDLKYDYILEDPYEEKGLRSELNLGHSLAHVIELKHKIRHGKAVGQGLHFALDFSFHKKILDKENYQKASMCLKKWGHEKKELTTGEEDFLKILKQDKKTKIKGHVRFVFLKKIGKAQIENIPYEELLSFAKENQWIK